MRQMDLASFSLEEREIEHFSLENKVARAWNWKHCRRHRIFKDAYFYAFRRLLLKRA